MNKREHLKHTAEQLLEKGNFTIIDSAFSTNYIAHAGNKKHKGLDFIKRFSKTLQNSIQDISVLNITVFIETNETISWQRTLKGTHVKNMMGIPASNKTVRWDEMVVSRFDGDKIAEEWIVSDLAAQLMFKLA